MALSTVFYETTATDAATGGLLAVAAVVAARAWWLRRGSDGGCFWTFASVGMAWLALDELLGLHERVAYATLPDVPLVNHRDDVTMLAYAVAGPLVLVVFRREIQANRRLPAWLGGMAAGTVLASLVDGFAPQGTRVFGPLEEWTELAVALMAVLAMWEGVAGEAQGGRESFASLEQSPDSDGTPGSRGQGRGS